MGLTERSLLEAEERQVPVTGAHREDAAVCGPGRVVDRRVVQTRKFGNRVRVLGVVHEHTAQRHHCKDQSVRSGDHRSRGTFGAGGGMLYELVRAAEAPHRDGGLFETGQGHARAGEIGAREDMRAVRVAQARRGGIFRRTENPGGGDDERAVGGPAYTSAWIINRTRKSDKLSVWFPCIELPEEGRHIGVCKQIRILHGRAFLSLRHSRDRSRCIGVLDPKVGGCERCLGTVRYVKTLLHFDDNMPPVGQLDRAPWLRFNLDTRDVLQRGSALQRMVGKECANLCQQYSLTLWTLQERSALCVTTYSPRGSQATPWM